MLKFDPTLLYQTLQKLSPQFNFLVAFSGGLDSHVLLHSLSHLSLEKPKIRIRAIHINHNLSPHDDEWAKHCQQVCQDLEIECEIIRVNIPESNKSLEELSRKARYKAFAKALLAHETLLTAHHCNDQAETLLLQLLRGAGPKGLASMPNKIPFAKGYLVRPLLSFTREQLQEYAIQHQLNWIEDDSNGDTRFDRNFLRHHVLPILQSRWPASVHTLRRAATHCAEAAHLLNELAEQDFQNVKGTEINRLNIPSLLQFSDSRQSNVIRFWLEKLGLSFPSTAKLKQLQRNILHSRHDAMPKIEWEGVELRRFRHELYALSPDTAVLDEELNWNLQDHLYLPHLGELRAKLVKGQGLKIDNLNSVTIRSRRGGERLHPLGRQGSHPLKKLFQEWNIPPWQRSRIPLVFVDGQLACVPNYAVDQKYKAQEEELGYQIEFLASF